MKRRWIIRYEPAAPRPYIAQSKGDEAVFDSSGGLAQFLADGALDGTAIEIVLDQIRAAGAMHRAWVDLEDAKT
jgi:hypothetical protein